MATDPKAPETLEPETPEAAEEQPQAAEAEHAPQPPESPEPGEPSEPPEPDAPEEDQEVKLEHDPEELSTKAQKADEYLELAQRTKADFENYRRRASREAAAAESRGLSKLARELLPAIDNLDRALEAAEGHDTADTLVSGIKLVHADVIAAFQRVGIEPFSPKGEVFDPQQHEAMAQHPVDGAEPGTVVEVYQRGYKLGDVVLRPARVVVAG
jgi:molecular chaperone GrpE